MAANRISPSSLQGFIRTLPGSWSQVTLPDDILSRAALSSDDNDTYLDARMVQYPSIEGPDGSLSAVVDFSINQIGIHKENSITFLNEESEVKI